MRKIDKSTKSFFLLFILTLNLFGQSYLIYATEPPPVVQEIVSSPKGHLVIAGGGRMASDIINKVISLSEKEKPLVVVFPQGKIKNPISSGNYLRKYNVDVINTHNKNGDEIISLIKKSVIIFFGGGNQRYLIKTLRKKKY